MSNLSSQTLLHLSQEEIATIRSKMSNLSSQGASRGSDYKCKPLGQPLSCFMFIWLFGVVVFDRFPPASPSQSPQKPRTIIPKNASKIQPNQKRYVIPTSFHILSCTTRLYLLESHPCLPSIPTTFSVTCAMEIQRS